MASYLASGIPLKDVYLTVKSPSPEYHVIYSFIKSIFTNKDCVRLTYQICELSLLMIPYLSTINSILMLINDNKTILINDSLLKSHQ